ncbi:protein involved in thiamine biosynthesis [Rhodanobacter spathiphylli B39]|uniref:FAD:protein FMN transferase n=2 Tax=Rhodanobacter TaxID=75309 RepID=I4W5J4_9GAMM|nr:protein involved in thiamine biosynthesis [Rhodanobacter spathiphylli B39]
MSLPRLAVCLILLAVSAPLAATQLQRMDGQTMGTTWSVQLVLPSAQSTEQVRRGIQAELDRVDGQMSTYRPQSELSRFNRAPAGSWQALPPEFFEVLQHALQLAKDSDGAYDPTVGPLVNLWGFGPDQRPRQPPTVAAIEQAKARVGWWKLRLDPVGHRAWQPGGVCVDLSAVAKGYGVDQVGRYLQRIGATTWLVEVGGELKARGRKPDGMPWRVGIERPDAAAGAVSAADELVRTIELDDRAVATSGDYRHVFEDNGRFYSHHIDPRSGWPVPHEVASVSVLANECMQADPLGTMLSVLGAEHGMAYAREHGLAVLMIVRTAQGFEQRMSPAFAAELRR